MEGALQRRVSRSKGSGARSLLRECAAVECGWSIRLLKRSGGGWVERSAGPTRPAERLTLVPCAAQYITHLQCGLWALVLTPSTPLLNFAKPSFCQ